MIENSHLEFSLVARPKISAADNSQGCQFPYIPLHTASANLRLGWKTWALLYKWSAYSERYTMSSNESSVGGILPAYYMSNVTLEKELKVGPCGLNLKLAVNNLFDEDYQTVLSRPMPGINFEFFVGIRL